MIGKDIASFNQLLHALQTGDDAYLEEAVAEDFVIHEDESLPYGGVYKGPLGLKTLYGIVHSSWRDAEFKHISQMETGDGRVQIVLEINGLIGKARSRISTFATEYWTKRDDKWAATRVWYYDTDLVNRAYAGEI